MANEAEGSVAINLQKIETEAHAWCVDVMLHREHKKVFVFVQLAFHPNKVKALKGRRVER